MSLLLTFAGSPPGGGGSAAPKITSASILANGTTLQIVFRKAVNGNAGFTLHGLTGGATGITYASGSGTTTLLYTIDRTVYATETGGLLDYAPGDVTSVAAATPLPAFTNRPVVNNSTQVVPGLPAAYQSLMAFWTGGARAPVGAVLPEQGAYASLMAFWTGGARPPAA